MKQTAEEKENQEAAPMHHQPDMPAPAITTPDEVFDQAHTQKSRSSSNGAARPSSNAAVLWGIAVLVLVVGTGGGFVTGFQLGKTNGTGTTLSQNGFGGQSSDGTGQMGGPGGAGGLSGRRAGVIGTVTAVSSTSVTVKDQMQSTSSTYTITDTTTVTDNGATASVGDIAVGDTVLIRTSSSSSDSNSSSSDDTSKTATAIELNPTMQGGMNQGGTSSL